MTGIMNPRVLKEFRSILFPTLLALGGAGLMAVQTNADQSTLDVLIETNVAFWLLLKVSPFVFYISLALAAALSYGFEFQHRTLTMLLTQPLSRSRIWREKLAALAIAVIVPVFTYCPRNSPCILRLRSMVAAVSNAAGFIHGCHHPRRNAPAGHGLLGGLLDLAGSVNIGRNGSRSRDSGHAIAGSA